MRDEEYPPLEISMWMHKLKIPTVKFKALSALPCSPNFIPTRSNSTGFRIQCCRSSAQPLTRQNQMMFSHQGKAWRAIPGYTKLLLSLLFFHLLYKSCCILLKGGCKNFGKRPIPPSGSEARINNNSSNARFAGFSQNMQPWELSISSSCI